jgi:site-specific DNA recombinase
VSTRSAVYTRLSRKTDKNVPNLEDQRVDCVALCEREGWSVVAELSDLGESAFDRDNPDDREGYAELVDLVQDGVVDVVVAYHTDRLWRDPVEQGLFLRDARKAELQLIVTPMTRIDPANDDDDFVLTILTAVAKKESADKRRRIRRKAKQLAYAGKLGGGGTRPFGYQADRVSVCEEEALLIKQAAQRVLAGDSLRSICTDWDNDGITTAGGVCQRCGERGSTGAPCKKKETSDECGGYIEGNRWTSTVLRRLLWSPRIAGLREHQGQVLAGVVTEWEAIIDLDTHEELVAILTNPARNKRITSRSYLLSSLAHCGACGKKLIARPKSDKQRCYVCASGVNFHGCGRIRRLADPVEDLVRDAVLYRLDGDGLLQALQESSGDDQQAKTLVEALTKLEGRLRRLNAEYAQEDLWTDEEFKEQKTALREKVKQTKDSLDRRGKNRILATLPSGDGDLREWWDEATVERRRGLVSMFVERVVVHPAVKGRTAFDPTRIEVVWRT